MNLLMLGGTRFVGRHMTEAALARGHRVTLFHRGQTNPELFPGAEKIHGDRARSLDLLRGRTWDAVLDVSGYLPRVVNASARALVGQVGRYVFISSISVYADFGVKHQNEDAPLATLDDPGVEEITGETYGGLKALCEQVVQNALPDASLVIRPGYVVGPYDPTDRWTSWLRRIVRGGEMLAPGTPDVPLQFIDGRDLAAFVLDQTERQGTGVYNTTGPDFPLTWGRAFEEARRVSGADTRFTWVALDWLAAHGIGEDQLPMVPPAGLTDIMTTDISRALAAGLSFRPLAETFRDTMEWDRDRGRAAFGIEAEREAELLREWISERGVT